MGKNKNNSINPPWEANTGGGGDEVEQLLRAAEDDVLLKLSTNSHIARSSVIDPDLDRRFQALKNPNSSSYSTVPPKQTTKITPTKTENKPTTAPVDDGDDLFARFAALKGPNPNRGSSSSDTGGSSSININQQLKPTVESEDEEDEDDEVEKLIKWAMDAARLDPSPPSDDDVESEPEVSDDDDDEDSDGKRKKLSKMK